MSRVTFDYSKAKTFIADHEMESMKKIAENAKTELLGREGAGNDFLGWIDLPVDYDKEEFARIKEAAERIKGDSEVLLVIGIGGSYLGARAAIEFLRHNFYNMVSKEIRKTPEIYFVGNSISSMAKTVQLRGFTQRLIRQEERSRILRQRKGMRLLLFRMT